MAGGTIDLHDIAAPEILDRARYSGRIPLSIPGCPMGASPASSMAIAPQQFRLKVGMHSDS
jgi:hypothetical protein